MSDQDADFKIEPKNDHQHTYEDEDPLEDSHSEAAEKFIAAYEKAIDDLEREIQLRMIAVKLVISVIIFVATRGPF